MKQIKNRFLAAMLVLCLLLTTLPMTALAAGNAFSVEKSSIAVGDTSTFKVSFTQPTTLTVSGLGLTLNFDKNAFEITSIDHAPYAAMQPDVTGCNNAGNVSIAYTDPTFDAATNVAENTVLLSVHFKVKDGATAGDKTFSITNYKVSGLYDSGSYTFADITPDAAVVGELTKTVTVYKAITSVSAKVNAPVKGAALDTTGTVDAGAEYTITNVGWFEGTGTSGSPVTGTAKANTVYTAKITLTANSGESFANSLNGTNTGEGYKIKWLSADKLELTKTFDATADKDPASVTTAPTPITDLEYAVIEQELVTAGTAANGTMQYKLGSDGTWSGDIPKAADAGEYTVYYKAKGDSSHSDSEVESVTVTIDPKDIGDSDVTVDPIAAVTYDGTAKTPAPVVKDGDDPLERDVDYTVSYSNHTNAGTATVTIKGKGNYGSQRMESFTINKAAQTITVPAEAQTVSFGNTLDLKTLCSSNAPGATLTFTVKSGSTLPSGTTLSGSIVTAGNTVGQFTVTVNASALPNYNAAAEKEITVKIVDLPAASVTTGPTAKTLTYNGAEQVLITAGAANGGEMKYKLDSGSYSSELPKAENAGTYTVYYKAKGDSAHSDSAEQSFTVTIGKKAATVAPKSFTITKGDTIPTFELIYTGLVSGDTLPPSATPAFICYESDGTTPVSTSTQAGTYTITWTNESTITFTGVDNYDLTKTATATLTISNPSSGGGGGGGVTTYAITVEDAKNGTITVSPKSASKGDTVTVTVKPDKGYELDTLKVLDSKNQVIKLTEKDGKYTFTMPASKVTVKGSFAKEAPEVPEQIFGDVPVDAYYYEAVKWAADKGITGGVGGNLFAPDQPCTRAQIVTFLWRAAGSPSPKSMSSFADVPADAYYAKAVAWAVENGITSGTGGGKFSPDAPCTRAQCVTFLYRAAGSPAVSGSPAFSDVASDAYYAKAVKWAEVTGLTTGIGSGLFGSDGNCTRAQIVTFLYRYMEK